ncbi:MAG: hypothetical protein GY740_08960 [Gammaproteobacteria bacterium]|nr:hypothetical protein [Gammaproteobacteria bacterium]
MSRNNSQSPPAACGGTQLAEILSNAVVRDLIYEQINMKDFNNLSLVCHSVKDSIWDFPKWEEVELLAFSMAQPNAEEGRAEASPVMITIAFAENSVTSRHWPVEKLPWLQPRRLVFTALSLDGTFLEWLLGEVGPFGRQLFCQQLEQFLVSTNLHHLRLMYLGQMPAGRADAHRLLLIQLEGLVEGLLNTFRVRLEALVFHEMDNLPKFFQLLGAPPLALLIRCGAPAYQAVAFSIYQFALMEGVRFRHIVYIGGYLGWCRRIVCSLGYVTAI